MLQEGSAVSVLNYFRTPDNPDQQEYTVCGVHNDTPLLTLGVLSGVPGLQMWDKTTCSYVHVEKGLKPGLVIVFPGEKLGLFAKGFEATTHRVVLPPNTTRLNTIYGLDTIL